MEETGKWEVRKRKGIRNTSGRKGRIGEKEREFNGKKSKYRKMVWGMNRKHFVRLQRGREASKRGRIK